MMARKTLLFISLIFATGSVWAADGFDDVFTETDTQDGQAATSVEISGSIGVALDYFVDEGWDSAVDASPESTLKLEAGSDTLTGSAVFSLGASNADVLDEINLRAFLPFGYLDAGLLKVEWGRGDGTHVIDPLNPLDQTNGISTDILDLKKAEIMTVMSFYLGESGLFELVYKPFFHPIQFATEGRWALGAPEVAPPDTETLEYSQGAARISGSLGAFDLGALYYYGFMSEPGYEITTAFTGTNPLDPTHYTVMMDMVYTRAQLFGIDGVVAVGPLTIWTELGYWLSEDKDGVRPELYNDRFVYLGGIDIMVPGTSIFLSVQVTGAYVVDYVDLIETDVDRMASFGDIPYSTSIVGAVEIPLVRDTLKVRLGGLYLVEAEGYVLIPELFWNIEDNLQLTISGQVFDGKDIGNSPYFAWSDNDAISATLSYMF
jgi:hypothetical protein